MTSSTVGGRSMGTAHVVLCCVRGAEGLIVELAERLDGAPGLNGETGQPGFERGGGRLGIA